MSEERLSPSKIILDTVDRTVRNAYHQYSAQDGSWVIDIAHGAISTTDILFVNEGIRVRVTAGGKVDFYDNEDHLLASAQDPAEDSGHGKYESIKCAVKDGKIVLNFPLYEWTDNYPHCDGEYDRWDCHLVGFKPDIGFDLLSRRLTTQS